MQFVAILTICPYSPVGIAVISMLVDGEEDYSADYKYDDISLELSLPENTTAFPPPWSDMYDPYFIPSSGNHNPVFF